MSYRCKLCGTVVGPNQPLRMHIIYREAPVADAYRKLPRSRWGAVRQEIAREIPACGSCLEAIAAGVDLHELITQGRKLRQNGKVANGNGYHKVTTLAFVNSPPPVSRGGNDDTPLCDVCGMDASDGQVTADTVLCLFHCKKAMGK